MMQLIIIDIIEIVMDKKIPEKLQKLQDLAH